MNKKYLDSLIEKEIGNEIMADNRFKDMMEDDDFKRDDGAENNIQVSKKQRDSFLFNTPYLTFL